MPEPYGLYAPKLADPPAGSDVIEEWEFFWGLAKRAELPMRFYRSKSFTGPRRDPSGPVDIPMDVKPTTDELLELATSGSRVSLAEVRRFGDGALFPEEIVTEPKDPDCTARLQLADPSMMDELGELAEAIAEGQQGPDMGDHAFLLVCRRAAHLNNSTGLDAPRLIRKGGTYNPAYLHPVDLERLSVAPGGDVEILSDHGVIRAVAASDETLRPGVVSMTHAYGRLPSEQADHRRHGSNTGRLLSVDHDFDRYSGIPRMSAVPVSVRGLG
jgi:anaerobic selenocysteine-containing dehydrogenase